jgi:hypothetical protein
LRSFDILTRLAGTRHIGMQQLIPDSGKPKVNTKPLVHLHYRATNISIVPHREQNLPPLQKAIGESCTAK